MLSSKSFSSKPIENVLSIPGSISLIYATVVLESIPPLKYAATSTSAFNLNFTELENSSLNSARASERLKPAFFLFKSRDQYFVTFKPFLLKTM